RVLGPAAIGCLFIAVLAFKNAFQAYFRGYVAVGGRVIRRDDDAQAFDNWVRNCFCISAGFFAVGAGAILLLLPEYYPEAWKKFGLFQLDNPKQLLDSVLLFAITALLSWVILRSLKTGKAVFKFRRFSQSYTFSRVTEPLRFWFVMAFYGLLAMTLGG